MRSRESNPIVLLPSSPRAQGLASNRWFILLQSIYNIFEPHLLVASEFIPLSTITEGIHMCPVEVEELNIVEQGVDSRLLVAPNGVGTCTVHS